MEPKITVSDADLELLLAEADREDPILRDPREDAAQPLDSIDSQILAGLVSPLRRLAAAARRAVAAASPTRSSPQNTPRATHSAGSRSAPSPTSWRDAASIAPSRRSSRAAFRQLSSRRPAAAP